MTKVRDLDQVLDVAAQLFGERGYEATKLEDIARELGVLKGSLYYYTHSKADLLHKINVRRLQSLVATATAIAASEEPPRQKLDQVLRIHLESIDKFWPESSQWFVQTTAPERTRVRSGRTRPTESSPLNHRYAAIISRIVISGQQSGDFRADLDPHIATLGILGACNWLTLWYRKGGPLTIEEISSTILGLLMDGLRAAIPPDNGMQRSPEEGESPGSRRPLAESLDV